MFLMKNFIVWLVNEFRESKAVGLLEISKRSLPFFTFYQKKSNLGHFTELKMHEKVQFCKLSEPWLQFGLFALLPCIPTSSSTLVFLACQVLNKTESTKKDEDKCNKLWRGCCAIKTIYMPLKCNIFCLQFR